MSQWESGNKIHRVAEDPQLKGGEMPFKSFVVQAAYNKLCLADQKLLQLNDAEAMVEAALKNPKGIFGIDETVQSFGIPMRVPARTEEEAAKRF